MHGGGFSEWNLPGIYNCMFHPSLQLQALSFFLPLSISTPLLFPTAPRSRSLFLAGFFPKNSLTKGRPYALKYCRRAGVV